jgi:hypothetical protein
VRAIDLTPPIVHETQQTFPRRGQDPLPHVGGGGRDETGLNTLICKGAVEEVMSFCTRVEVKGEVIEVLPEREAKRRQLADMMLLRFQPDSFAGLANDGGAEDNPSCRSASQHFPTEGCRITLLMLLVFTRPTGRFIYGPLRHWKRNASN